MSVLFWLDIVASALAAIICAALMLVVLGAGARRAVNYFFVFYALAGAAWAGSHAVVVLTLWIQQGQPWFWQEVSTLSFGLMGGWLTLFATRYVERPSRWADLVSLFGLGLVGLSLVPPFRQHLLADLGLDAHGLPVFKLGTWGYIASAIVALYYVWCLGLFWRERRQRGPYLALSVFVLLVGLGLRLSLPQVPITSVTATASIAILGFAVVSQQLFNPLRELTLELERKVEERTRELERAYQDLSQRSAELEATSQSLQAASQRAERRAAQIVIGAEIARVATTLLDPDHLIPQIVQLIQERFDYYYVGLFLVDADGQQAVLQYGLGSGSAHDAGRIMKERGHKLEIGGQSMIGWACAHKQARIALDVGEDAVRFANPLTPETRSEMALPLRAGERVTGALSVQSTQEAAFDQEDIAALQGMADQIAVALENARLFQQTQATLKELETTNRLLVREGWQTQLERASATRRAELQTSTDRPATGPLSEPLSIPLELRGQALGQLTLRREGERPWTGDEVELVKTIALQTVLAADNARLVEQTQLALQESEGLYRAAQRITAATELDEICQQLTSQASELLQADRTTLFLLDHAQQRIALSAGHGNIGDDLQVTYAELHAGISGMVLDSGQAVLSTSADDGIEPQETRQRRKQAGTGALIVAPLLAKGEVIGTLTVINRAEQRKFTQHDVDLLMALVAQATIAIQNVRLLDEAQQRAQREQTIAHIATHMRDAPNVEGVLRTAVHEIRRALGASHGVVRLGATEGDPRPPGDTHER